jgi:D-glycero-D-manno-heptose 1,7-bisphosphate phosphatase
LNRAVFLDRDGTIIEDVGYLRDSRSIRPLPGALEILFKLREAGWLLIVITNQSGVGKGLISSDVMLEVQSAFEAMMRRAGAAVTATYCCLHTPEENCDCRKPSPSLFFRAAAENNVDLSRSWMIGDRESDILSGRNAGCSTIWLRNNVHPLNPELPDFTANDWREIEHLLSGAPSNPQIFR